MKKEKDRKQLIQPPKLCPVCGKKTIKDKEETIIRCENTNNCEDNN